MEDIIRALEASISDELLTKSERKELRALLEQTPLTPDNVNFIRSKIYELAHQKSTADNYKFIIDWIKDVNSALTFKAPVSNSYAYFSPGESCRGAILQQITDATRSLKICVFTISDDSITNAILLAHKKGIAVKIITDNDKSLDLGSDIRQLAQSGIEVKMDATPNHMHHKFMLIDDKVLVTGSYNWTQSAARFNHENVLVLNDVGVVRDFLKEFDRLWSRMVAY